MTQPSPQDAARVAARRFCGWHVTPVIEGDVVDLDGPGSPLLVLPTLRLLKDGLTSVVENGTTLDVADLWVSSRGLVRKKSGACWAGNYGALVVTMTHGFETAAAADFEAAVASYAERSSASKFRAIGPFQYNTETMAASSAFSVVERSLLEQYRLESAP